MPAYRGATCHDRDMPSDGPQQIPRVRAFAVLIAVTGLLAGACSSSHPTAGPTASATPEITPAQALATLAGAASGKAYVATYLTVASHPGKPGRQATATVSIRPPRYRVDILANGATAVLIGGGPLDAISCGLGPTIKTYCLKVATHGKPLPPIFDPGVQRVVTDDLAVLAARPDAFTVMTRPGIDATAGTPAASCFAVSPLPQPPAPADPRIALVDTGVWCLSADGLAVRLAFASGTLTLRKVAPAPAFSVFAAPAPPQPLPT